MDFKHGGDVYSAANAWKVSIDDIRDFSANINPFGFRQDLLLNLVQDLSMVSHYPDPKYRALKAALGQHYTLNPEQILVGNGGIELIYRTLQGLKPQRVGIVAPTFIEYERAALGLECELIVLQRDDLNSELGLKELLDFASKVDVLFLCNPNNPTGSILDRKMLLTVMQEVPQTTFVVDEAFMEFVCHSAEYTVINDANDLSNLVVIRSMTKIYSMPGLRLGFLYTGNQELLQRIHKVMNPWNVNAFVSQYMIHLLKDNPIKWTYCAELKEQRELLTDALSSHSGFQVFPSHANYLFFRYSGPIDWSRALASYYVLIRDCSNYRGLNKGDYRIAVKSPADNAYFIECINEIIRSTRHD